MKQIVRWFCNRAIRLQLVASVAGVHAVLMTFLVADIVHRQQDFLADRARHRVLEQSGLLAAASLQHLLTNDLASLAAALRTLSNARTVRYAMVTDPQGYVLAHTDSRKTGKYLRDPEHVRVLSSQREHQLVGESEDSLESASPVLLDGRLLGWAWVAGDRGPDRQHTAWVARAGATYTAGAILLGSVFAALLVRIIMRPLRLLLAGARRLAADRLDEPIPETGRNEMGVVTRAFNQAMRRLREQREQLRASQDELELRVQRRTQELSEANEDLKREIRERERIQDELSRARAELEQRVAERTAELAQANRALLGEIAERKEIEEALLRTNEDLKEFAYAVSHDLQQPLRSLIGYTQLLERRYGGSLDGDARDFIHYISEGSQRMQQLIRDLLAYSRAAASSEEPAHSVDCSQCLRDALLNLEVAVETSGAVIDWPPLPNVLAHEVAVLQVFQNLLSNAIKYRGPKPPCIQVAAVRKEDEVEFTFRDNGIGIDPAYHAAVFRLFRRLHTDECGTGIGLAICARIVQRYGGRIWVESKPGEGSSFRFTLPAA